MASQEQRGKRPRATDAEQLVVLVKGFAGGVYRPQDPALVTTYRPGRDGKITTPLIGMTMKHALALVQLMSHYTDKTTTTSSVSSTAGSPACSIPSATEVYAPVAKTMWRSMLVHQPAGGWLGDRTGGSYNPWRGHQVQLEDLHPETSSSAETPSEDPTQLAMAGALNQVHRFLPAVFLQEERPVTNHDDAMSRNFGHFLLALVRSNQRDVVALMLRHFQLDLEESWLEFYDGEGGASDIGTCLHVAAFSGHLKLAAFLIEKGSLPSSDRTGMSGTPLTHALSQGHTAMARSLIEKGADVNYCGEGTALHQMVDKGNHAAVRMLLSLNADSNIKGTLSWMFQYPDSQGDDYFEDLDEQPEEGPIHTAVRRGDHQMLQLLLKHPGVNVDLKDHHGRTALYRALANNDPRGKPLDVQIPLALTLIANGASGAADSNGETPLHLVAQINSVQIATSLHQGGHKVDAETIEHEGIPGRHDPYEDFERDPWVAGETPLHHAVRSGVAAVLINAGANVNKKNSEGCTPLHKAAANGRANLVQLLLRHGAKKTIKNDEGKTPMQVASTWGDAKEVAEVETLLRDARPQPPTRGNVVQCRGTTQGGERCKVTSGMGMEKANPLKQGNQYCGMHRNQGI